VKKSLALLFALAALLLIGWYGYRTLVERQTGFPLPVLTQPKAEKKLPVAAGDWHGRIDYHGLDRDFTLLAAQPEMAGLAVAIVESGELRFIGTYGVADKDSGKRVMPDTVFRWASVSKGVAGSLAAKLSQAGKVDLEAPLSSWHSSLRLASWRMARIPACSVRSLSTRRCNVCRAVVTAIRISPLMRRARYWDRPPELYILMRCNSSCSSRLA
jgi:beta-lactamase class C